MSSEESVKEPRQSRRKKQNARRYSPPPSIRSTPLMRSKRPVQTRSTKPDPPHHFAPDGSPFCCEKCSSPYIVRPANRQKSRSNLRPRYVVKDGRRMMLCNACGLSAIREKNKAVKLPKASEEDKQSYWEECIQFSRLLQKLTNDENAQKLLCPNYKAREPCDCVRRCLSDESTFMARTELLLQWTKVAQQLKDVKFYHEEEAEKRKPGLIGSGNGQKKSADYSEFILSTRTKLRQEFKLCEKATQKILGYSNNFIHKRLKTENDKRRAAKIRGKAALGTLIPIAELPGQQCCSQDCTQMAIAYPVLLRQWRERSQLSQAEARSVIAEMRTPAAMKCNCYSFVHMVTGLSKGTIAKVSKQMRNTGGEREPTQHGLNSVCNANSTQSDTPPQASTSCTTLTEVPNMSTESLTIPLYDCDPQQDCLDVSGGSFPKVTTQLIPQDNTSSDLLRAEMMEFVKGSFDQPTALLVEDSHDHLSF